MSKCENEVLKISKALHMYILIEVFSEGGNSISFNDMYVHKRAHLSTMGFYPLKKHELKAPELVRKYAYKNTARIKTLRNNIKRCPFTDCY